jgi:hypothetical protein
VLGAVQGLTYIPVGLDIPVPQAHMFKEDLLPDG